MWTVFFDRTERPQRNRSAAGGGFQFDIRHFGHRAGEDGAHRLVGRRCRMQTQRESDTADRLEHFMKHVPTSTSLSEARIVARLAAWASYRASLASAKLWP